MLLNLEGIEFGYHSNERLFNQLNFSLEQGKIVAIIGESGCGKTTLLSLIYGLLNWQKGKIVFNDLERFGPKGNLVPGERDMKMVAQIYDLMDHAHVYENVGKFISNIDREYKSAKIRQLLEIVGMEDFYNAYPKNLSGGQQQRIAIARALAQLPKLLLLDEPFNSLDFSRKTKLREKLFRYVRENDISLLISTHNVTDIMPWVDEVVVLQNGKIVQQGSPQDIYEQPKNEYVARLFGEVNILSDGEQQRLGVSKWHYFPQQIQIGIEGNFAQVLESGFSGGFYRNLVLFKDKKLICYSHEKQTGFVKIKFL